MRRVTPASIAYVAMLVSKPLGKLFLILLTDHLQGSVLAVLRGTVSQPTLQKELRPSDILQIRFRPFPRRGA
jgi:hypothetical protein